MIKDGERFLVAGRSGYGKSYFCKQTLIPAMVKHRPVVVFDRKLEYAGPRSIDADPSWKGYQGIEGFFNHIEKTGFITQDVHVIACRKERDYIAGLRLFEQLQAPITIMIDEAHDVYKDPDFFAAKKHLLKMVRWGRSFGIDVVIITQRTYDIPPDLRSQLTGLITFSQIHEDDIRAISKMGYTQTDEIQALEKREKLILGDIPERIKKEIM